MAAPTFVGAGAGVIIQTGGAAVTAAGSGVAVGDLIILQVLQDGAAASAVTYSAISGIANLAGTASSLTTLATDQPCGATLAKQHLRVGRATSTTCTVTATTTGDDLYCRIYVFRNVNTGTALTDILENGTAGTITNGAGATAAVTDTAVTTLGADRLALQFVAVDDDNPLGLFSGATGGVWYEAIPEFASATGTDGAIQLQVGSVADVMYWPAYGGVTYFSVYGGTGTSERQAQPFASGAGGAVTLVAFPAQKIGAPTDDIVVEIQTDAAGLPSGTVVGTGSAPAAQLDTGTYGSFVTVAVAATLSPSTNYWLVWSRSGSRDTTNAIKLVQDAVAPAAAYPGSSYSRASGTWASNAADLSFAVSYGAAGTIDGGSQTMAAADNWGVIGFALKPLPSGPATLYGVVARNITFGEVTAAQRRTTSSLAMPVAFGAVVAGQVSVPAVTHYGALAAPFAFNAVTAARRRTTSQVAAPFTFSKAVAGQRKTFGATATPVTFTKAVAGSRKTFGQTATPLTFAAVTAGIGTTGAVTHYGALTAPFTFAAVTQGRRRTTSSLSAPFTFTKDVRAQRRTTGQTATSLTFGAVTASRKQYARTTTALTFSAAITATKKTYGVVARPITFAAVTAGIGFTGAQTRFGATSVSLTFTKAVQGTKKTFAQTATPLTFSRAVQAQRRTTSTIAAVFTLNRAVQAQRKTHAQTATTITWLAVTKGISTVGIQTYYGVVARPITFSAVVQAKRRTTTTITMPITISAFTKGMLMAAILNYADDIRWGTIQADRVMVGTTEVWTP